MEINVIKIFKIDIEQEEVEIIDPAAYGEDLIGYLEELFGAVISGGSGRQFTFVRTTTEVRAQITRINKSEDFADISHVIATRLLTSEVDAQSKIKKLGVIIQKGIIVQALIDDDTHKKFIICKADHHEFLNEDNFKKSRGLPIKKKAFKAFVCNLNESDEVEGVLVFDTNPKDTRYWWGEFLELTMVHTDEDNTENAFNSIDSSVFTKLKKDYPQDYTYLRNSTIRYFRANERFEMQDFLDNGIGEYTPIDPKLNIADLKNTIRALPEKPKAPFDNQFNIVREKITARFKRTIQLTEQIELHIKENFPENAIIAEEGTDGVKYVKIRSEEGYKYFKKILNKS